MLSSVKFKILLCSLLIFVLVGCVSYIFWNQEIKYQLPTPKPVGFKKVKLLSNILIADNIVSKTGKPLLLHFFNPECPCSKFNSKHVKELIKKYSSAVSFAIVIPTEESKELVSKYFSDSIPLVIDKDKKLAMQCGVYATPNAVILTSNHQLWYNGNYNKSRYCTSPNSNYAEQALNALLNHQDNYKSPSVAYGCSIFNLQP